MRTKPRGGPSVELTTERDGVGDPDPGLWIRAEAPLGRVTVELSVRVAGREVGWVVGPLWTEARELWVPLLVPGDAVVDAAQAEWLTPLSGWVVTDVGPQLADGALVWPQGLDGPVEVWDDATQEARAPHGVVGLGDGSEVTDTGRGVVRSPAASAAAGLWEAFARDARGNLVDSEGDVVNLRFAAPGPLVPAPPPGRTGGLRE